MLLGEASLEGKGILSSHCIPPHHRAAVTMTIDT